MDRPGAEFPILIAQTGPLNGQRWVLDRELVVGRDPSCSLVINDRQVSRYHVRFELTPQGVFLEDLGSKNGTYLNGKRINEIQSLSDGDSVQVALVQHFTFFSSDATMPLDTGVLPMERNEGLLVLDPRSRRVWINHQEVTPPLSAQQFKLLQVLERSRGEVVSRQTLIDEVWGAEESAGVSEQAFDALVRRLRDRLSSMDPQHAYIVTVRGHGLRLENPQK